MKKWDREHFIEYRKLKRSGYSHKELKKHFGDIIYESGLYNKNGLSIAKFNNFINEIKITPEEVDYNYIKQPSNFIKNKSDYIISFYNNDNPYIISFVYFPINNKETFNVIFTTRDQWNEYEYKLRQLMRSGNISENDFIELDETIGSQTKLNELFPVFRKISWIVIDFYEQFLTDYYLSIGDTGDSRKIKFYRNIIKDSFPNFIETEKNVVNNKYYLYK